MKVSGNTGGGTDPNTQRAGNEEQAPEDTKTTTMNTQTDQDNLTVRDQPTTSENLPVISEDQTQSLDETQEQPPPYESVMSDSSLYINNAGRVNDGNKEKSGRTVLLSGEPDFPVKELQKLDESLSKTKWVVPVTPGGELETLMIAAIDLCKKGLDTRSEPCQRFFREGLHSSFTKLMMDDAVTSWKPEIHQYIYDSCLKLIELCVAKLADDWFPLLELLSMIFNGNNKFHQVNNSEPAKMLPRDGSTASEILYAESHDHYVKGWLVDFVNTFGNLNGFNILRDRIVKGSNLSVPVMAALLKPFTGCVQVLAIKCVENYLLPCCDRVLEAVETLTDDDLKKEVKNESKSDSLSSIVKSLKVMYQRVPERQAMLEEIETFRLKMILRLLRISSFSGKMNALNEVNRLVQSVYSFSSRTAYDDEETGVTAERLADWIQENSVLSIVLKDNLHQPQYVERLEKILWFMIRQKALSQDDLDTLWAAQVDKHEAIVKNVHDLLARLAWNFSAEQLDYLFQCFQRSWTHAGKRQREKLLELIRRLAEDDKEGVMAVKVLGLLWNLAHSEDCPKEIMEQALAAHIKILDYSCAADRDRQKTHWLVRCIDELKQDLWVLPAIKMIHDIFSMYFEGPSNISVHSHHNLYYRQEVITHFQQHHRLIELVTDNLGLYMEKARKYTEANPSTEPMELMIDGRVAHESQVTERLNFLRFILKDGQLYLPFDSAQKIWHRLAEKAVFPCDREAAFKWFSKVMGEDPDLEPDVGRPFFEDHVLKINPSDVTESGMKCFERAFTMVNQREHKLTAKRHHRVTNDLALVGLEYLWKLFLHGSDDIASRAIEIVKNVYTNLGPVLEPKQVTIHRQFIQKCFEYLHHSYNVLSGLKVELDANDRDVVNQHSTLMVRCLSLLREYIAECDAAHEDERAILPHGKSWLGRHVMWTVRFPMPNGRSEDLEVTTHSNESLAAVRRKIIRLRRGYSQSARLDLYINSELVNPAEDKKLIHQLPFRDKQLVTAKLSHMRHTASPSQDSSSDSSTNSASNPFEGPNIEAEQSLPGVIISRDPSHCDFLLTIGQLGIHFNVPSLRDSVRQLLELIPTDQGAISKIRQCTAEVTVNGMAELSKLCYDLPPLNTLYHLEVVHSMLLPASSFEEEQAIQFQVWFFENGGIALLLNLLKEGKFMREADNTTRRTAYSVCIKLAKLMLCALGFAKVATWTRIAQRGESLPQLDHNSCQRIHQSLLQLPGLQYDLSIRTIASRLGQMANIESVKRLDLPSLETIHAIQRLAWAASAGSIYLVHGTLDGIHAAHERSPGMAGRAVEPECSSIAKEALEVLSVCLSLFPIGHDSLTREADWKKFIIDVLLMSKLKVVRVSACNQFFLMITRCATDSRPLHYFKVLLFAGLETDVVKRAKTSSEYFMLLCHILSHICQTREIQFDVDHRLSLEIQWLDDIKAKFEVSGGPVVDDVLLEGHMNVIKELLAFKTSDEKRKIGSKEGHGLINVLVEDFLCPASKLLLQAKKTCGPLPSEPVKAICSVGFTQKAAYDLLVALSTGCVGNLEELCELQEELFYKDNAIPLIEWEFAPPVGPRPVKGFVGLKNAGATCYMNSVVQMLYMIPAIRNYILKVEDLWKESEEEETSFVEEKNLKNQQLSERAENEQEPRNDEKPSFPNGNQEEDRNTYRVTVVKQIQCIFGHLLKSRLQYYTPRGLWKSFRMQDRPVNVREQQDAMEFFNGVVDGVDEGLKTMHHEQIAVKVMGGVFADQKICKGCPHRYAKEEPFMSISVDIRHHQHLLESLEQYVKGDLLEGDNAYFCEKCEKKVDTIKRTCIQKLPPVLVIQLKRFDYDWERDCAVKFNDYIEFPRELDMEPYTVQGLAKLEGETIDVSDDPDKDTDTKEKNEEDSNSCMRYRLAGIVVHSGQASGGHYYSYIAQRIEGQGTKWFKFEDGEVGEARMEDEEELKNQCFGGEFMGETYDHVMKRMQYRRQKRWWNAYLLFYEREDMPFTVVGTDGTPSPNLPGAIERAVQRENLEYSHTKAQFSSEYFKFMQALAQANMPSITDRRPEISELQEQLVMLTVKLLTKFLFSVGFHTKKMIRGSALEWSTILLTLLRCSKNVRFWFVTKALFEHPERFSEYLLECPSQEVRSAFSKLIAFLAHYSLDDGPYNRPFSLPSYEVATAPQMIETQIPSVDLHTLSDYLLDAALSLLKKEVGEHDRHLQQYFQLFLTYANQGISEQTQLLRMRLPSLFISLSVGEGPISLGYRHNSTDFTKLHSVVSLLIRCCDISERSRTMYQGMEPMENPFCEMPNPVAMHPDLDHAVFGSHKYIKKLIQENAGSEDTVRLVRFCCWENPIFSRMVLTELLFQLSYVYSYELKPYLDFLLHILLIEDSWQNPRILNTIRGFRDEQGADGLVDVIQRGRSHYQKRAYQCIKMMVVLFTSCQVANDFLHKDHILKRQWHDAVVWLAEELERRPYGHSYGYNNWSPPAQSNETSNGYFLERSNSAKQTLSRAYELCPVEEQPEEPETLMDESPQDRDSPISQPNNQYNSDTVHDSPDSQRRRPKSPVSPTQVRVTQTGPNTRIELRKANKTKSVDNLDQIEDFPSNQNVQESVPLQYMEED